MNKKFYLVLVPFIIAQYSLGQGKENTTNCINIRNIHENSISQFNRKEIINEKNDEYKNWSYPNIKKEALNSRKKKSAKSDKLYLESTFDSTYADRDYFYYKELYFYDIDGNVTKTSGYKWDNILNKWIFVNAENCIYDSLGNLTQFSSLYWDSYANMWVGFKKTENLFDSVSNIITCVEYEWDYSNNLWLLSLREENDYDSIGFLKTKSKYNWDNAKNEWVIKTQERYIYDSIHNLNKIMNFSRDSYNNDWVNSYFDEYLYDSCNNVIRHNGYYWNSLLNIWKGIDREEWVYNIHNNITQHNIYRSLNQLNDWEFYRKEEYSYDSFENCTQSVVSEWESYSGWNVIMELKYVFNNSYPISTLIVPDWYDSKNMIIKKYKQLNGFPSSTSALTYYYTDKLNTNLEVNKVNLLSVYPNPFSDQLTINIPNDSFHYFFELFDIQGRRLLFEEINADNHCINMSNFSKGFYLYRLSKGGKTQMGKIIKE